MIMIAEQFCEHGSLLSFMAAFKTEIDLSLMMHLGTDVARGMAYIADLGFVHRDLAVRATCFAGCGSG